MNDWVRIQAELFADTSRHRETLNQAWRWADPARRWLDEHDIDARKATKGDIQRYLSDTSGLHGVRDRHKLVWSFNLLVEAACGIPSNTRASPTGTARARLETVPARSPLGKAIARTLARAKNGGDRRRWPTCLGTFLLWCDEQNIATDDIWPGHVSAFRLDYLASGRTSPGEYVRVARRLVAELTA